jgi:hypothetical protein
MMDYELDTPGTSDLILMPSGSLMLNGQQFADFDFMPLANFGAGTYDLIEAGSISGSLGANTSGTIDGYAATLAVEGDELVLNVGAVPEPSAGAILATGVIGLMGYVWRRRRLARTAKPATFDQPDAPILSFPSQASPATAALRAA